MQALIRGLRMTAQPHHLSAIEVALNRNAGEPQPIAKMRLVIIESPYAGDIPRNISYARACVRDSVLRGEAPICSHLLFTQQDILRDEIEEERALGIAAGLAWTRVCDAAAFYIDYGFSAGMTDSMSTYEHNNIVMIARKIL